MYLPEKYYSQTIAFQESRWFHVVLNYLGEDGDMEGFNVYHSKKLVGPRTSEYTKQSSPGNSRVVLGRQFTDDDHYYTSVQVDELMFFNRNLLASDIEAFYNLYQ